MIYLIAIVLELSASPPKGHADPPTTQTVQPVEKRLAVPTTAELAEPNQQIDEIFATDLRDASATGRRLLAAKLISQSVTAASPAEEYALLSKAKMLAIFAGDASNGLDATKWIITRFNVNPTDAHLDVLRSLSKTAVTSADREMLVNSAFDAADLAAQADQYSIANSFLQSIKPLLEKEDSSTLNAWREKQKRIQEISTDSSAFKSANTALQKNPNDPAANLIAGRFYYLRKNNWTKALSYLAKSSDIKIRTAAKDELAASSVTGAPSAANSSRLLGLADQWWYAAQTQPANECIAIQSHAAALYQPILPTLTGLTALRVRKRMDLIAAATSPPADQSAKLNPAPAANKDAGTGATDAKLQDDVRELLADSEKFSQRGAHSTTLQRFELLCSSSSREKLKQRTTDQDATLPQVKTRMIPLLLADTGYQTTANADLVEGTGHVSFSAAPVLASLCRRGQGALVSHIAEDSKESDAARVTCMLALHLAGDDIPPTTLLLLVDKHTTLECRVLALLMLGYNKISNGEIAKLVTALDDDNEEIRVAALITLDLLDPAAALPKIKQLMHDGNSSEMILYSFRLLGKLHGDEPAAVLIDYMEKQLADGSTERSRLDMALFALSEITGQRWTEAGAHKPDYYAKKASQAIAWWHANHP